MEVWQRKHITRNMVSLLTETENLTLLMRTLIAEEVLCLPDKATIEAKSNAMEQVAEFYDTLMTRVNSYEKLVRVLKEQGQQKAADILDRGYAEAGLLKSPFNKVESRNQLVNTGEENEGIPLSSASSSGQQLLGGGGKILPSHNTPYLIPTNARVNSFINLIMEDELAVAEWMEVVDALGSITTTGGSAKENSIQNLLDTDSRREAVQASLTRVMSYISKQVEKSQLKAFRALLKDEWGEPQDLAGNIC